MPPRKKQEPNAPVEPKQNDLSPADPDEEQAAQQRYSDALAAGLSEAEAREVGWPSTPENSPADDETAGEDGAAADNPPDIAIGAEVEAEQAELVEVDRPCRKCYKHGWPEGTQVEGGFASCHHGLGIRFGEVAQVAREQAAAMGFEV